jgi:tetratricopeptide (TPR) repeat protein
MRPPEQVINGIVGTHTDVYGLGATLYELLTEKLPLPSEDLTPGEAENAIRTRQPASPSRVVDRDTKWLRGEDWSDLDLLCATALRKEPMRRYRTVDIFIRDIDHWLRNEPLEAHEDSWLYRTQKFASRNRKPLTLAALLALVVISGVIWFTLDLAKAKNEALRQQVKTPRVEKFVLSLFDNGDPSVGPVKSASALTMLDRGRKEAEALKADPDFRTEVYEVLGSQYVKLGRYSEANQLLQAALITADPEATPKITGQRLLQLGLLKEDESRLAEADKYVHQALAMIRTDRTSTRQDVAGAEAAVGEVFLAEQKVNDARPILRQAVQLQYGSDAPQYGDPQTLSLLAEAQHEAGNYVQAVVLDRRFLALARSEYGDSNPLVGNAWMQLGSAQYLQGKATDAVSDYTRALAIYKGWYGEEHPKVVECTFDLAQAQMTAGLEEEARQNFRTGFAIATRVLPDAGKDQRSIFALNALASLEQRAKKLCRSPPRLFSQDQRR